MHGHPALQSKHAERPADAKSGDHTGLVPCAHSVAITTPIRKEDSLNGNRPGATRERLYASTTATFDGDIDFIAIERVLNGDPVRLTAQEQLLTARLLDSRGVTATAIGKLIRADHTTVSRWKDNGWNAGPPPRGGCQRHERRPNAVKPACIGAT